LTADSEDRAHLDLSYQVMNATFPAPTADVPIPEASVISIGRDFYALSANLLSGTPFMWGINLKLGNLTDTVAQASLLADTFQGSRKDVTKDVKLVNLEIGNEPDFYSIQGKGYDSSWTPQNYSDTWRQYASAVNKVIKLDNGGTTYSAGAFATFSSGLEWNTGATLEAGIMADSDTRSKTSHFAEHQYSGAFGYGPTAQAGQLMDKGTIRGNLSTKWADVKAARSTGLSFILVSGQSLGDPAWLLQQVDLVSSAD
jgi:hypothetical protein